MTNITESSVYEEGIYLLETTDPNLGGVPILVDGVPTTGHANAQAQQLANRTKWLYDNKANNNDLADTVGELKGSYLVGFNQSSAGSVGRTVKDKLRELISVKDFGAVGDGITDDTSAIQSAINHGGYGSVVVFPKSSVGYKISNNIDVPIGVSLVGPGKVMRTHGLSVSNYGFTLNGQNNVNGLVYDGGSKTIASPGNPLSIKDFNCVGSFISFNNNQFTNSCGTFINFTDSQYIVSSKVTGLIVNGNIFQDYLDHCIYCQGYKLVETSEINVSNNVFEGADITTTRQAVKLKNIERATISNNSFNLPNGIFITVDTGLDAPLEARDCTDIVVSSNSGRAFKFLETVASVETVNRNYFVRNLTIVGNIATCTGDYVSLGLVPSGGTSYATRLENVIISSNTFSGRYLVINGDVNVVNDGIVNLIISENNFNKLSGTTLLQTYGNIKTLIFKSNVASMTTAYDAANSILNRKACCDFPLLPTIQGFFDISDNTLLGNFGSFISEQPSGAVTSINFICNLNRNKNLGSGASKRVAVLTSSVINSATGVIYAEHNQLSFGGTAAASACANKLLLLESDFSKRYVDPANNSSEQFGYYALYVCSADLGFDPLSLGAGVYYQAYRKGDGAYVRVS